MEVFMIYGLVEVANSAILAKCRIVTWLSDERGSILAVLLFHMSHLCIKSVNNVWHLILASVSDLASIVSLFNYSGPVMK